MAKEAKDVQMYELEFKSIPENIAEVEPFIERMREVYEISESMYANVLICVTEAANNAILHGNKANPDKKVKLIVFKEGSVVTFRIDDEGDGFDYQHLPDPTAPENIEKLTGRGVFFMRQLSDTVIFSNGGSTVDMQFRV